jgi:hypothetical protein
MNGYRPIRFFFCRDPGSYAQPGGGAWHRMAAAQMSIWKCTMPLGLFHDILPDPFEHRLLELGFSPVVPSPRA